MKLLLSRASKALLSLSLPPKTHHVILDRGAACGAYPIKPLITRFFLTNRVLHRTFSGSCSLPRKPSSNRSGVSGIEHKRRKPLAASRGDRRTLSNLQQRHNDDWTAETIHLSVGGNGTVSVDISTYSPMLDNRQDKPYSHRDVLIYLPHGPFPKDLSEEHAGILSERGLQVGDIDSEVIASEITSSAGNHSVAAVVKINYRLSPNTKPEETPEDHRYPTPIHDVLSAFDWIMVNIILPLSRTEELSREDEDHGQLERGSRISIFGSHIGGSIALMLALTQPNEIHAIAVSDPICDWVVLDEILESASMSLPARKRGKPGSEATRVQTQRAASALIDLRTKLFRNPSSFFDAFASPLLFLRAPGRDTPLWKTARPEYQEYERDDDGWLDRMKQEGGVQVNELETKEVVDEMGYGPYDDDWHTVEHLSGGQGHSASSHTSFKSAGDSAQNTHESVNYGSTRLLAVQGDGVAVDQQPMVKDSTTRIQSDISIPPRSENTEGSSTQTLSQALSDSLDVKTFSKLGPRRRRVIRRWPPVGQPEDVDLPWTRIYSTVHPPIVEGVTSEQDPRVDLSFVLHSQAKEMLDVMTRACFWGREKSLGEERVTLEMLPGGQIEGEVREQHDRLLPETTNDSASTQREHAVLRRAIGWLTEVGKVPK